MRVLITGGAGFVGFNLAKSFRLNFPKAHIVALDNLRRRGSELNLKSMRRLEIEFVHGDVRVASDLWDLPGNFDIIVDAAAEPSVQAGYANSPQYVVDTNVTGTFNCLNFARRRGSRFVFLSTSRVYSIHTLQEICLAQTEFRFEIEDTQTIPGVSAEGISEDFPTALARSFYGTSKLSAEYFVQEFAANYGIKPIVLRCGVIAGPGQFGKVDQGVFTLWIANHYFRQPLRYTGFGGLGKQVRDVLHIDDLCGLILQTLERDDLYTARVFNVGGGRENSVSLMEMTGICQTITGNKVPIASVSETSKVDIPLFISDCRRIYSESAWRPRYSVETLVRDTVQWIADNEAAAKAIFVPEGA